MPVSQQLAQSNKKYKPIPAIDGLTSTFSDPSILHMQVFDNYAAKKVSITPKPLNPARLNFLSKLFYDEKSIPKLYSILNSDLSSSFSNSALHTPSGSFLRITYPQINTEKIYLSERLFVNRAYDKASPDLYDESLMTAASSVVQDIISFISTNNPKENKFNIAIRIPVENKDAYDENLKISSGLADVITRLLKEYDIDATIMVSLVKMTFSTLSNLVDEKNFSFIKRALLTDAKNDDGILLFKNNKVNPQLINIDPVLYGSLSNISLAKDYISLRNSLEKLGHLGIYFPNHKKNIAIRNCYDKLRYVGITPKSPIFLDPSSGYIYLFSKTTLSKSGIVKTYQQMKKNPITITYIDDGTPKVLRCHLEYDEMGAFTGPTNSSLVLVDENSNYINAYSLLKDRGYSLIISQSSNGSTPTPLLKIVKLDKSSEPKFPIIQKSIPKKIPPNLEKTNPAHKEVPVYEYNPILTEDDYVEKVKEKNIYVALRTDHSDSMENLILPVETAFSSVSEKISKGDEVDVNWSKLAGEFDPDHYNVSIVNFLDWVEKNKVAGKKYHLILVGDGGDTKWNYEKYLKRALEDNVYIHFIYTNRDGDNLAPLFPQLAELSFFSGGLVVDLSGHDADYFEDNQDEIRLDVLKMIHNAHPHTDSETADFYLMLGEYDKSIKLNPKLSKIVAKKSLERAKNNLYNHVYNGPSIIKDLDRAAELDSELAAEVGEIYLNLAKSDLDNHYSYSTISPYLQRASKYGDEDVREDVADIEFNHHDFDAAIKSNPKLQEDIGEYYYDLAKDKFGGYLSRSDEYFAYALKYDPSLEEDIADFYLDNKIVSKPIVMNAIKKHEDIKERALDVLLDLGDEQLDIKYGDYFTYRAKPEQFFNLALKIDPNIADEIAKRYNDHGDSQSAQHYLYLKKSNFTNLNLELDIDDLSTGKPSIPPKIRKSAPNNKLGNLLNYYNLGFLYDDISNLDNIEKYGGTIVGQSIIANLGLLALTGKSDETIINAAIKSFERLDEITKRFKSNYTAILNSHPQSSDEYSSNQLAAAQAYYNILNDPKDPITYGVSKSFVSQFSANSLMLDCDLTSMLFLNLCNDVGVNAKFVSCKKGGPIANHAAVAFLDNKNNVISYFDSTGIMYVGTKNSHEAVEAIYPPAMYEKSFSSVYLSDNISMPILYSILESRVGGSDDILQKNSETFIKRHTKIGSDYYSAWNKNKTNLSTFYSSVLFMSRASFYAREYLKIETNPIKRKKLQKINASLINKLKLIKNNAKAYVNKSTLKEIFDAMNNSFKTGI